MASASRSNSSRSSRRQILSATRSEEHTSELQSRLHLVCRLLLEKKKNIQTPRSSGCPSSSTSPVLGSLFPTTFYRQTSLSRSRPTERQIASCATHTRL